MSNLEQEIRAFILENCPIPGSAPDLAGHDSLTRRGVVDSVGVLELILFLETSYGIDIPDDEVRPENIDSIDNIVRYVGSKLAPARGI